MSDNNLDFLSIFSGEGSLDLGSSQTSIDALFAQPEETQHPETTAGEAPQNPAEPDPAPAANPQLEPQPEKQDQPAEVPAPSDHAEAVPTASDPSAPSADSAEEEAQTPQPAQAARQKPIASRGKTPVSSPELEKTPEDNPFEAAMKQVDAKVAADMVGPLAAKPPVFQFGGVTEDVTDSKMTFEQLRESKKDDFPELEDGKRVSWTVEYGKVTKTVPKPKEAAIHAMKAEIEQSESFLDILKKAKEKDFTCKVRPHIAAQTKGIASYKGIFRTLEEMEQAPKVINLVPARDGHVYEIRCMETGRYITRARDVNELSEIRAGFYPALPLIPFYLVQQVIGFFRSYMHGGCETEALVRVYWDKEAEEFLIDVPQQQVSKARVFASIPVESEYSDRLIHYADIHSHNSMPAKFSSIDDEDEKATRLYLVMGRLDQYFPEVSARICNGGTFLSIHPGDILEGVPKDFPSRWCDRVTSDSGAFPITGAEDEPFSLKGAVAA